VGCLPFCDFHPVGQDGEGGGIQIIYRLVQWLNSCVSSFDAGRTKSVESRKTEETISGTEVTAKFPEVLPNVTSYIGGFLKEVKLQILCDKDRESWNIKRTLLTSNLYHIFWITSPADGVLQRCTVGPWRDKSLIWGLFFE
jgi:hypothetical protein